MWLLKFWTVYPAKLNNFSHSVIANGLFFALILCHFQAIFAKPEKGLGD
jgi:hypothetical protein